MRKVHAAPHRGKVSVLVDGVRVGPFPGELPDPTFNGTEAHGCVRCPSCGGFRVAGEICQVVRCAEIYAVQCAIDDEPDVGDALVLELLPGGEP